MHSVSEPAVQIVALLLGAVLVAGACARFGVSAPLVLTAVGIVVSLVPGVPDYSLDPQVALTGFLPPLLYAAAIRTPVVDLRRNRRAIILLSVVLVLVTSFAVGGVVVLLLPGVSFAAGVALGAVVAPPDAVAATAVARRIGMPRRVVTLLEGESLLNDATALVILRTALAAISVTLSVGSVALDFGRAVAFGAVGGWAVAALVTPLRRRVSDPVFDTTLSLLVPYIAYLLAEEVGGSGVLAVVMAGLILGHRSPEIQDAGSRVTERAIWRAVQFMLESVIFLIIGLQLRTLLDKALSGSVDNGRILVFCVAVVLTVIVVRIVWVFPATYLPRLVPAVRRNETKSPPWQAVFLVSWAGMRGVVTVAAALTLTGIEGSETLIIAAFAVVVASLLIQGATLPWVVRLLKVPGPDEAQDALQQALVLQRAVDAGRARLEELSGTAPKQVVHSLEAWGERLVNAVWERLGNPSSETPTRAFRRLRVAMLDAERRVVVDVRRSGAVAPEVLEGVLERLDQEEAMLSAFAEATAVSDSVLAPPQDPDACEHLRRADLVAVPSSAPDACAACVAMGKDDWVSLRMCLACGNIACCDSSPRRHAEGHFRETAHPVMRSVELGEAWRWCYVDRQVG